MAEAHIVSSLIPALAPPGAQIEMNPPISVSRRAGLLVRGLGPACHGRRSRGTVTLGTALGTAVCGWGVVLIVKKKKQNRYVLDGTRAALARAGADHGAVAVRESGRQSPSRLVTVRSSWSSPRFRMRRLASRQPAGVTPAQQFLALGVDDGPAGIQDRLLIRPGGRRRFPSRPPRPPRLLRPLRPLRPPRPPRPPRPWRCPVPRPAGTSVAGPRCWPAARPGRRRGLQASAVIWSSRDSPASAAAARASLRSAAASAGSARTPSARTIGPNVTPWPARVTTTTT